MATLEPDILIVGGGIAGSALACGLRGTGYSVVMLEQRKGLLDTARGDHLQPCNVEVLARWEVLDRFLEAGAVKRIGHEFRTAAGEPLLTVRYGELPIPYPYFLVFHHELMAELFLELAGENPNFQLLRPVLARNFEISEDRISAVVIDQPGGETITISPRLVVGADGSNSQVRAAMRFSAAECHYVHPMVALFGPRPAELRPNDYLFRYSGKSGILIIQQRMNDSIKVILPVGEEGTSFWNNSTGDSRAEFLAQRAEVLKEFDSEVGGFYPVKMVHCDQYVRGNVVLIGDAAHSIHPARGQGLNMAIQSLPKLIGCLPSTAEMADEESLRISLLQYQIYQKPLYDKIVAKNHEAALAMESTAGADRLEAIRQQDEQCRRINQEPELRKQHLLEACGYPYGVPLSSWVGLPKKGLEPDIDLHA